MVPSIPMGAGSHEQNPFAPPSEEADFSVSHDVGAYRLATYAQRLAGSIIDSMLYVIVVLPSAWAAYQRVYAGGWAFSGALLSIVLFAGYQWWLIATTGQSVAKRWLHTRIIQENGEPPGFVHGVVLRSWVIPLLGAVPVAGGLVGLADALAIFFGTTRQTLHDRIARTLVIQA